MELILDDQIGFLSKVGLGVWRKVVLTQLQTSPFFFFFAQQLIKVRSLFIYFYFFNRLPILSLPLSTIIHPYDVFSLVSKGKINLDR